MKAIRKMFIYPFKMHETNISLVSWSPGVGPWCIEKLLGPLSYEGRPAYNRRAWLVRPELIDGLGWKQQTLKKQFRNSPLPALLSSGTTRPAPHCALDKGGLQVGGFRLALEGIPQSCETRRTNSPHWASAALLYKEGYSSSNSGSPWASAPPVVRTCRGNDNAVRFRLPLQFPRGAAGTGPEAAPGSPPQKTLG